MQIQSLNLVDEDGNIVLGDEMLTPDSSRFWPAEGYELVMVSHRLISSLPEIGLKQMMDMIGLCQRILSIKQLTNIYRHMSFSPERNYNIKVLANCCESYKIRPSRYNCRIRE